MDQFGSCLSVTPSKPRRVRRASLASGYCIEVRTNTIADARKARYGPDSQAIDIISEYNSKIDGIQCYTPPSRLKLFRFSSISYASLPSSAWRRVTFSGDAVVGSGSSLCESRSPGDPELPDPASPLLYESTELRVSPFRGVEEDGFSATSMDPSWLSMPSALRNFSSTSAVFFVR